MISNNKTYSIDVLGLAPSLKEYKPTGNLTIGVNDIGAYYPADVVICVDPLYRFKGERKQTLCRYKPKTFWSHQMCHKQFHPEYKSYIVGRGTASLRDIENPNTVIMGTTSVYAACTLAYNYYKAKEINVYGCDLIDHPAMKDKLPRLIRQFTELFDYFKSKGVTVNVYCGLSDILQGVNVK
jgi:hypothetical protein